MKRITTALVLLLLVGGCSGTGDYSQKQFNSIKALADVVSAADGWSCAAATDDNDATRSAIDKYGFDSGPCSAGAVAIFGSDAKRADFTSKSWNALQPGHCRLDGANWAAFGQQYMINTLQKHMGGTITCG